MTWTGPPDDDLPTTGEPDDAPGSRTHPFAVYSIALGVAAFIGLYAFPFACFAFGVPSVTTAIHARRAIAASRGEYDGDSAAVIGLTIGAGALVTGLIAFFPTILNDL